MIIDAFFIIMVLYELYLMFVGPGVPVKLGDARSQIKQGLTSKLKNSRTYWKNLTKGNCPWN